MYAIEINLLKERQGASQAAPRTRFGLPVDLTDRNPLLLGIAAGAGMVGLVVGIYLVLALLNQRLTAREQTLDNQLAEIGPRVGSVETLQAQTQQFQAQTQALTTIFNQVKPWAAMLQDLRDRTPPRLQVTQITQTGAVAPTTAPQASPADGASPAPSPSPAGAPAAAPAPAQPTGNLTISGNSLSFGSINDFVLGLKRSPFLKGEMTQLTQAQLQEGTQTVVPLAEFQIQSGITDVPASELLLELNQNGATGLVTRIKALKDQGVLQP